MIPSGFLDACRRLYSAITSGRLRLEEGVKLKKLEAEGSDFLTKAELRTRLNLPSTRMIDELMRKRLIPFVKLGHKTVRFSWVKCAAALARLEVHEIGR